jgi:hypothetical protein
MKRTRAIAARTSTIGELVLLIRESGRWWLLPMLFVLLASALLLVVVHAVEYVAPFVYTIF